MNPLWGLAVVPSLPFLARWLCRRLGLEKPNFRGDVIPAACGLSIVLAAGVSLALGGGVVAGVALALGLLGLLDDLKGDRSVGGFQGHLKALLSGRPTTGSVKLVGGGLVALLGAYLLVGLSWRMPLGALLIALGANSVNLLDTRPGRAHFGFALLFAPSLALARPFPLPLAPLFLAALVEWPFDSRARSMLGDTGANALGALAGALALVTLPLAAQGGVLVLLLGLNLASERVSLQSVIEKTPWLRWLDRRLGERS
jgi:UDP-N-acetylmuramyl pentapeptide phosphotransferase/UDP-N-acetylglucosamine-1-phosphate transferase